MLGMQDVNADQMSTKFDDMLTTIKQVNEQFRNAVSVRWLVDWCCCLSSLFVVCGLIIICKFLFMCTVVLFVINYTFDS